MPVLCIGPVCIPLNLLLPFLLGLAHRYGWLQWVKREWLTLAHWRGGRASTANAAAGGVEPQAAAGAGGASSSQRARYVCEGDVCRIVPGDEAAAAVAGGAEQQQVSGSSKPAAGPAASATAAGVRQRPNAGGLVGVRAVDL